jgi:hypothetical protein
MAAAEPRAAPLEPPVGRCIIIVIIVIISVKGKE